MKKEIPNQSHPKLLAVMGFMDMHLANRGINIGKLECLANWKGYNVSQTNHMDAKIKIFPVFIHYPSHFHTLSRR